VVGRLPPPVLKLFVCVLSASVDVPPTIRPDHGPGWSVVRRSWIYIPKIMKRKKKIRVSDAEHRRLNDKKLELFGTDKVPFGAVVSELLDRYEENN